VVSSIPPRRQAPPVRPVNPAHARLPRL
jgi:hypothetical protein